MLVKFKKEMSFDRYNKRKSKIQRLLRPFKRDYFDNTNQSLPYTIKHTLASMPHNRRIASNLCTSFRFNSPTT